MSMLMLLRLDAPVMAFGDETYWDERTTDTLPRKSAIAGMIGCAMGLPRGDQRIADICAELTMSVRVDAPGHRETDFQTVAGDPLMTANGTPRSVGNTLIKHTEYLWDANFLVVLGGDPDRLRTVREALTHPAELMYIGRRNCVLTRPPLDAVTDGYATAWDALQNHDVRASGCCLAESETAPPDRPAIRMLRRDVIRDPLRREFGVRTVWRAALDCGGKPNVLDPS